MRKILVIILSLAAISVIAFTVMNDSNAFRLLSPDTKNTIANSISSDLSRLSSEASQAYSQVSSGVSSEVSSAVSQISSACSAASSAAPKPSAVASSSSSAQQDVQSKEPVPVTPKVTATPPAPPSGGTSSSVSSGYWGQTGISGLKVYEYGKTLLNADEQSCYDQITDALLNVQTRITVNTGLEPTDMEKIYQYVMNDQPELFYYYSVSMSYQYSKQPNGQAVYSSYTFTFNYDYNAGDIAAMRSQIAAAAAPLLARANQYASDYDKEKYLHDAIIAACSYDLSAAENPSATNPSFTAYSALVSGKAVCEGYAKAMKLLLDSVGVKSLYITGTASNGQDSGGHAWNIVNVSGKWYYLDATFDDPVYATSTGYDLTNKTPSYTYFNFTFAPDHAVGSFDSSSPFDDNSQNYGTMPAIG